MKHSREGNAIVILRASFMKLGLYAFLVKDPRFLSEDTKELMALPVESVEETVFGLVLRSARPDEKDFKFSRTQVLVAWEHVAGVIWHDDDAKAAARQFGYLKPD
jgi:hypothetical protein